MNYFNPFVPYFFAALENDDVDYFDADSNISYNNDNSMIFSMLSFDISDNTTFYVEFLIDDYQINPDPVQNMLGMKIGLSRNYQIIAHNINMRFDYTVIDSWTYIHKGQYTNWQNRGHSIGYSYGNDLRSLTLQADYWIKKDRLWMDMKYTWLEKGNTVYDFSNGKNLKVSKKVYYTLGHIPVDGYKNYKYTINDVRKKVLQTGHWGPWDSKPPR